MTGKVMITRLATPFQISDAMLSKHIAATERDRLIRQMQGSEHYTPRRGSVGHLKCKSDGCYNIALDGARKQLCPVHYVPFLERSNATHAMPRCHLCATHTRLELHGTPTCVACATEIADLEVAAQAYDHKMRMLEDATTVHELREWIKDYLLRD